LKFEISFTPVSNPLRLGTRR